MFLLVILEFLFCFFIFPVEATLEKILQEANDSYQQGIHATTYETRKQAFNHSLSLYSLLDQEGGSFSPSLEQALADNYFHLGEYAWAVLYYEKALKNHSSPSLLISHLAKARQKLGLNPDSLSKDHLFNEFLRTFLQRSKLLLWVSLFTFLFCSLAIWFSYAWIRQLAATFAFFLCLLLGTSLFFYYSTPLQGILVTSIGFYRGPDEKQPQLTHYPLLAGSKIQVLQITLEGKWLKVTNSTGLVGYIPTHSLRLI